MTNLTTLPKPDDNTLRFPSFTSLRQAHSDLLKLYREADNKDTLVPNIHALIEKGRETGALIDNDDDRLAAQSLLDYWVSVLLRSGHSIDDATLTEFDITLAPELDEANCPYLGLDAFLEKHANLFYGRQRLVAQLIESLTSNSFLAVIGPSGSGKSSVVRGGLIPKLKAGALPHSDQWHYFSPMVPGSTPLENLVKTLAPNSGADADWVQKQMHQLEAGSVSLAALIRQRGREHPTVLVIDQFEEVFTLCPETIRDAFIKHLVALVQATEAPRHYLILTMRSDFETQVAKLPQFLPLFEATLVRVLPLDAGELREAIEAPAEQVGLKFEVGVVDQLVTDVLGEPAALPLLQFMLLQLWEHRDRNRVTYHAYQQLGGGRGALAHSADEFYTNLIPEDQETAKRILLKMVRPSTGLEVTNNRIRQQELHQLGIDPGRINRVLDKLCADRLVRRTPGETPDDNQIEVAHEALIRNWPRLIEWLDDERVNLRQRLRLADTAQEWETRGYPPEMLLRGELLDEAQQYDDLNEVESEFVSQSKNQDDKERPKRQRRKYLADCAMEWKTRGHPRDLLLKGILLAEATQYSDLNEFEVEFVSKSSQKSKLEKRIYRLTIVSIVSLLSLLSGTLLISLKWSGEANTKLEEANTKLEKVVEQAKSESERADAERYRADAIVIETDAQIESLKSQLSVLSLAVSEDSQISEQIQDIQESLQSQEEPLVSIDYFRKDNDPKAIRDVLNKFKSREGFEVNEIQASVVRNQPTNAIWFGEGVPVADVKELTRQLIDGGVDIRSIIFKDDWPNHRSQLIQLGGNYTGTCARDWQIEDLEGINSINNFPKSSRGVSVGCAPQ